MKINKKIIEELVAYLKEFNLTEIEYSEEKTKSNKIHISGFISDKISLFVNETQIQTIENDKSFYHKINTSNEKLYRLEIDILSKLK